MLPTSNAKQAKPSNPLTVSASTPEQSPPRLTNSSNRRFLPNSNITMVLPNENGVTSQNPAFPGAN